MNHNFVFLLRLISNFLNEKNYHKYLKDLAKLNSIKGQKRKKRRLWWWWAKKDRTRFIGFIRIYDTSTSPRAHFHFPNASLSLFFLSLTRSPFTYSSTPQRYPFLFDLPLLCSSPRPPITTAMGNLPEISIYLFVYSLILSLRFVFWFGFGFGFHVHFHVFRFITATENPFKSILKTLEKPGGGEIGKYYSLPALNDPRIGQLLAVFFYYLVYSCRLTVGNEMYQKIIIKIFSSLVVWFIYFYFEVENGKMKKPRRLELYTCLR